MATEKRLIDANALMDYIDKEHPYAGLPMASLVCTKELLTYAPTVDAVEVVRCKDCKHFVQGEPYDPCECMKWTTKWGVAYTTPDGFCHHGEHKIENP